MEQVEESAADEQPAADKSTGSGEQHQPKTDADIHEAGSLFDL